MLIAFLLLSWSYLDPTEMALKYNYVTKTVDPEIVIQPGLKFVCPWNSLIRYPKTIQTMTYDNSHRDLLDGRTRDGLPLILGLSFQYRLLADPPESLFHLYKTFENNIGDYIRVYQLVGMHIITELATNFTAYKFFNEKQAIAYEMQNALDNYFRRNLFATVESLQINEDDLPTAFTDSVLQAANSKQNITQMTKAREAKKVEFQTMVNIARAQANVTIAKAHGQKHRILQNGYADRAVIEAYVEAERQAYEEIHKTMELEGDALIKYIWYDTLGGGGVSSSSTSGGDVQMMVGVDPAAYITQVQSS